MAEAALGTRVVSRLSSYLQNEPELQRRYLRLRQHASGIVGSNYDVSDRCNLRCEGCLYFAGSDRAGHADTEGDAAWEAMFAAEKARGVNFAYLAGAEPALSPARLRAAAAHVGRGVIFTNGTVAVDPRLPFTLHISVWGDQAATATLRGGDSFEKAFRLFGADRRARFILTVNARNLASSWSVAERCAREGAILSFSLFSPTVQYEAKLATAASNDADYFRVSTPDAHLVPDTAGLAEIHATLQAVAARFPDTVRYSRAYGRWVTDPAGLYAIDSLSGLATDCGTRNTARHRHIRADLSRGGSKCCSPNIDCRSCRAYSMAAGTAVSRFRRFAVTLEGFRDWLDISEQWAALFLRDFPSD